MVLDGEAPFDRLRLGGLGWLVRHYGASPNIQPTPSIAWRRVES
jgi:hypothetical protein